MTRLISLATAGALAMATVLTTDVAAQNFNVQERTFLTFSAPVELPGTRLQAGTYLFRIADTPTRDVVQVLSENEEEILGQWLYVPAERQETTGETVITFRETRAGATPAIQYWYFPGEKIGKEFIYPKDQAMQIAERTGATVMTEEGPVSAGTAGAAATTGTDADAADKADKADDPDTAGIEADVDLEDPDVNVDVDRK